MDAQVDIKLQTTADTTGFKQTQDALRGVAADLKSIGAKMEAAAGGARTNAALQETAAMSERASGSMSRFSQTFMQAMGMGAGFGVGGMLAFKLAEGIQRSVEGIKEMVGEGVKFNAELENMRLGVAASLRAFDPAKYTSFNAALAASATVIDSLKEKSLQFGIGFSGLAEQYQATAGAMFKGGIDDLQKQIDLSVILNRAMQQMGVSGYRAVRDIADILNGMANRTTAGRVFESMGITDATLKSASDAGQLYEFLTSKLGAFNTAINESTDNITVLQERLKNTAMVEAADQTQGLTNAYRDLLKSLIVLVQSDAFKQSISFVAKFARNVAEMVKTTSDFVSGNGSAWGNMETRIKGSTAALEKFVKAAKDVKTPEDVARVKAMGEKLFGAGSPTGSTIGPDGKTTLSPIHSVGTAVASIGQYSASLSPLQEAISANPNSPISASLAVQLAYKQKYLDAAQKALAAAQAEMKVLDASAAARIKANAAAEASAAAARAEAKHAEEITQTREKLIKELPHLQEAEQNAALARAKATDPALYLRMLDAQKAGLQSQLSGAGADFKSYLGAGDAGNPQVAAQAKQAADAFTLSVQNKIAAVEARITSEKREQARLADEQAKRAQQQALADNDAKQIPLKQELTDIEKKRADIQQNLGITAIERQQQLTANAADYKNVLAAIIALEQDRLKLTSDPRERAQIEAQIHSLTAKGADFGKPRESKIDRANAGVAALSDPALHYQSAGEGVRGGAESFYASAGTMGDQAARAMDSTLGASVQSITHGIMSWIDGVKSFGQAMRSIGGSVLNAMLQQLVQIGAQWVVNSLLIKTHLISIEALQDAQRAQRVVKENAANAAVLPMQTAGAAASGISSFGLALIFGVLAVGLILALSKGFESGGFTARGGRSDVAGVVHAGEWVAPQWMVNHPMYGPMVGMLEAARTGSGSPIGALTRPQAVTQLAQAGGLSAPGGVSVSQPAIHVYHDYADFTRAMQNNSTDWFYNMSAAYARKNA